MSALFLLQVFMAMDRKSIENVKLGSCESRNVAFEKCLFEGAIEFTSNVGRFSVDKPCEGGAIVDELGCADVEDELVKFCEA